MPSRRRFVFDPFELDGAGRQLTASGHRIAASDRQLDILRYLVEHAGRIVGKDELLQVGWRDVAVGDNSLEQAISGLRRLFEAHTDAVVIETVPRRGYRFAAPVTSIASRESDAALDALLAPHRAFLEGRALLETLSRDRVRQARAVFEDAVRRAPDDASAHVGLANACALQFEATRADLLPDTTAMVTASHHAREACRLDPQSAEAWATLGFVLGRAGEGLDGRAASRRAIALEPGNWLHHVRLAYVGWGEERLRAAERTLSLLPGFALAHWLAATVYVARGLVGDAARELDTALARSGGAPASPRFAPVALHWLRGLIRLSRGDDAGALDDFERELASEHGGQVYGRETAANAWYAIGALHVRRNRGDDARFAFTEAVRRVSAHPAAGAALAVMGAERPSSAAAGPDAAIAQAVMLVLAGDRAGAGRLVADALTLAPPGNAGWLLPVEPLLDVAGDPLPWAAALARLANRAA